MADFGVSEINQWISQNQALVTAVGVPLLTVIVTTIVSVTTTRANLRAQVRQRQLGRDLKWAEFRRAYVEDLRNDISEFIMVSSKAVNTEEVAGAHNIARSLRAKILMKVPSMLDFYDQFSKLSEDCINCSSPKEFERFEAILIKSAKNYMRVHWTETRTTLKLETEWT